MTVKVMKTEITLSGIYILKTAMRGLYFFLKFFSVKKNKVLFCSRQSNDIPLDFVLIQEELKKESADVKTVDICCHIGHRAKDYVKFAIATLRSMYHLATSKVCILDAYWPAVSLLKHKRELKVIQIWHATGKIKKSGYQSLGKVSGRNERYARALNMHGNYDYIIAGAASWNRYYCEAFGVEESKLLNYGLPRIDYLLDTEKQNRNRFFDEFPELRNKKIVLYAPTFRRNMKSRWDEITEAFENEDYVLIIKNHPGQMISKVNRAKRIYYMKNWNSIDLIAVSDFVITDYSAIALEAAVLKKKTYYWTYDYDEYMENNGLNIDLKEEMKPYVFKDANDIVKSMKNDIYDMDVINKYRDNYLPEDMGKCTEKIAALVSKFIEEDFTENEENSDNGRR